MRKLLKRKPKPVEVPEDDEPEHEYYQTVPDPFEGYPRFETCGEALKQMYKFNEPCVMVDRMMGGLMVIEMNRVTPDDKPLFAKASHVDRPVALTYHANFMQAQALKQALRGEREGSATKKQAKPKKSAKRPLLKKKR